MGMGVVQEKKRMPGAHKIGAAVSGPRIAGGKVTDMRFFSFLKEGNQKCEKRLPKRDRKREKGYQKWPKKVSRLPLFVCR